MPGNRGSKATASGLNGLPVQFPGAAQPDIVRASQKDELYLQYLADACLEAVRNLLGPRRALLWIREIRLFAELLYHGLTTGAGLQTLGEEYCDILQVSGAVGVAPSAVRRGLLVLLQSLAPYIVESMPLLHSPGTLQQRPSSQAPRAFPRLSGQAPAVASAAASVATSGQGTAPTKARAQACAQAVRRGAEAVWAGWSEHSATLGRLHLALFYFYGIYYAWPKRLTGVRYLFIGKLFETRPSYHVLGVLLFTQITASALVQGLHSFAMRQRATHQQQAGILEGNAGALKGKMQPAIVLQEDADEEASSSYAPQSHTNSDPQSPGEVPPHQRCPLCLSRRDVPTSTPCGHVFCWRCICEWGVQKPECPLCRAPFTPSSLVCLHGSDF